MTPSKRAKQLGAKSLNQIAETWGCTRENLRHKFKHKPNQFDIIVLGCVSKLTGGKNEIQNRV